MKKFLAVIWFVLALAIQSIQADARGIMLGRGTILPATAGVTANISTVNGAAFVTSPSTSLAPYAARGLKITISDGAQSATAWIGAGSTETLDSELCTDTGFDNAGSWVAGTNVSIAGGKATGVNATINETTRQEGILTAPTGKLYKFSTVVDAVTLGSIANRIAGSVSGSAITAAGTHVSYLTGTAGATGAAGIITLAQASYVADSFSVKQVLAPDATGAKLYSARFGTTQNLSTNTGLNANAASFTITISKQ